ncbi:MAG: zinc ribbon domain-containing protein [Thermodesulfovibrionales bacterium]|jgi:DNA-directed RNA polymerase subunit RPC12/RpoP|nr:zinc ribbon domain-containing protein [Thermodesulfovibrionales bacterium]
MAVEYICFSCGNHFVISQSAMHNAEGNSCPKCGSANILKLNPQSLYGLFGGGG